MLRFFIAKGHIIELFDEIMCFFFNFHSEYKISYSGDSYGLWDCVLLLMCMPKTIDALFIYQKDDALIKD